MSTKPIDRNVYRNFLYKYEEQFKNDGELLYNFRCICARLLQCISNYEFWTKEKDCVQELIDTSRLLLKNYYYLKDICCDIPKLSKLCKHTTVMSKIIKGEL